MSTFEDPQAVARYAEGPLRQVPGFLALQQMSQLLLAEHVPLEGRVLVLGAGGGLELKAFAEAHPGWRLLGVDPAAPMLALAEQTLGPLMAQVELLEGYIDDAPDVRFDGASCLLTLHFLDASRRLHTLRELHRRLRPGAPLVVAHHSVPADDAGKRRWLQRYVAFAEASGVAHADAQRTIEVMIERLPLQSPEQDVALLQQAGFEGVELFYAGFSFKGWVAYAS
ncbi:methyltransferase [Stenotrophomonas sp. SAU14A_NAIMI4_5]|uniref:class I SAM-dependent methyltransferase n=1 Tax=Stenotrophomonas sp. SAU14A_NAIMI4_5 TaxID=2072413 RepID=UPI000D542586|nr:class I SAM-dependent methyltransferase [Stenotrophomonas sp. SAU14A_NAIMI4_5]AWH48628.1 methyltransferase [Stenotrophomonas sp. SAU14A_NAIMI4_5]